jgi:hypothetical protein
MHKKDYIKAAEIVRSSYELDEDRGFWIEQAFIRLFRNNNIRFNEMSFLEACRSKK